MTASEQPAIEEPGAEARSGMMLIDGELVASVSDEWMEALNPATEQVIGRFPRGNAEDVELAVTAAERAQPGWGDLPVADRVRYLSALADAVEARAAEFVAVEVADTGNTITGMAGDIASCVDRVRYNAGLAHELQGTTMPSAPDRLVMTLREPFGVVGRIVAFNHPAAMTIHGVAAPLIAGNTIVVKPSELCSLSATLFAEVASKVLPAGVVNLVTGEFPVGDAIVRHPRVKRLSFVGSPQTGMAIQRSAAEVAVKSVSLELGGKNPFIVFPDAEPEEVARAAVNGMNFVWQGQSCNSTSRLLVHDSIHDAVVDRVVELVAKIQPGDPTLHATRMGAMVSRAQLERVEQYVALACEEGARLRLGGKRPSGPVHERGFWFEPTVFDQVTPDMRIAKEEVFGPVLSVIRWNDEDDVLQMANESEFGLTGVVWTRDISRALQSAKRLQSGYVWVNGSAVNAKALPFGGYKNSGVGRERGLQEIYSYTETKSIQIFL